LIQLFGQMGPIGFPEQPARPSSRNNMREIMLAFHNYQNVYGKFPTDILHPVTKKPLLSWRVAILPYIEQEPLYKQFKLDEPWDSAHNRRLMRMMPKTYTTSPRKGHTRTAYQLFTGPGTAYPNMMTVLKLADFKDSPENTALLGEARVEVDWTRPADIVV